MQNNNFPGVVESLLKGMDTVLSTKTVVGEATQIGDTIILPLVDVSFGVGAGAGAEDKKNHGGGGMGGTYNLLAHTRPLTNGVTTTFVDPEEEGSFEAAIQENTKAIFVETLGNPNSNLVDL